MATLAEQRKAIAAGISSSRAATGGAERRATGSRIEAERRGIGQRIEAERRGESEVEDINRLINPAQQRRTLRTLQPVGALPAARGRATYVPPPAVSTGGGIASPLTETLAADRTWWGVGWPSTDGVFEYPAERRVLMTDANGAPVEFLYANPAP